jgi:hypothetical protein
MSRDQQRIGPLRRCSLEGGRLRDGSSGGRQLHGVRRRNGKYHSARTGRVRDGPRYDVLVSQQRIRWRERRPVQFRLPGPIPFGQCFRSAAARHKFWLNSVSNPENLALLTIPTTRLPGSLAFAIEAYLSSKTLVIGIAVDVAGHEEAIL